MDFSDALRSAKAGEHIAREGWNGRNMWVAVQDVSDWPTDARMRAFLYMFTVDKQYVPWVASQSDLLADDWVVEGR